MPYYYSICPKCKEYLVTDECKKDETTKKIVPLFPCYKCETYYVHSNEEALSLKTAGVLDGMPIYYSNEKYTIGTSQEHPEIKRIKEAEEKNKQLERAKARSEAILQNIHEPVRNQPKREIRIQKLNKDSEIRMKGIFDNLRATYPMMFPESMTLSRLIEKAFPSVIYQHCVIKNTSFAGNNGNLIRRAEIYNKTSSYLNQFMPNDTYLVFSGKISNGEFVIDDIRILENPIKTENDYDTEVQFFYDGPKKTNYLYDLTNNAAQKSDLIKGELASWDEYLTWKRKLAESRIKGIKYIDFRVDMEQRQMIFLVLTENKDEFEEFERYLIRNEISIFSNRYSKNRWKFVFNREYNDSHDAGIPLNFVRFGTTYNTRTYWESDWPKRKRNAQRYPKEESIIGKALWDSIRNEYEHPLYHEITFEFSEFASKITRRRLRSKGTLDENIERNIEQEFFYDGFIANSQIGDFALIWRLQRGIDNLANGKSASVGLDKWLFDIKKARQPKEEVMITSWQNPNMNLQQKLAVKKILSVPDVCLIQGPPGTGKTTVIAEAIYQLVTRNKRVMIASQANLAVDNALERLISNPKIRAIRLGSSKKIDSSVNSITEDNVLESFYTSLVSYVKNKYICHWDVADSVVRQADTDLKQYQGYEQALANNRIQASILKNEISDLQQSLIRFEDVDQYGLRLAVLRDEKASVLALNQYLTVFDDSIHSIVLSPAIITRLWDNSKAALLRLREQGLVLADRYSDNQTSNTIKEVIKKSLLSQKLLKRFEQEDFQDETSIELTELKIEEKNLTELMLASDDISIMLKWKEIKLKIHELENKTGGLSDSERELFSSTLLDGQEIQAQYIVMKELLKATSPIVASVIQGFITSCHEALELIGDELDKIEKERQILFDKKTVAETALQECQATEQRNQFKMQNILIKYQATDSTLEDKINEKISSAKELEDNCPIERDIWEDIMRGLVEWVDDIPDYTQEKEIYLRDFINGCNVVGVSCTENARTLTEKGFSDFDVVIIDEVSKATPPELLLPMLRGRKIVLVGDHRQLPPLFNEHEKSYQEVAEQQNGDETNVVLTMDDFKKYKNMVTASLFERYFENAPQNIKETLTTQYRMHEDIMDIINFFYDGCLKDGNYEYDNDTKAHYLNISSTYGTEMIVPHRHAYWIDSSSIAGEPIYEFRRPGSTSAENIVEAEIILELLRKIEIQYANRDEQKEPVSIGVISFYFDQVARMRKMIQQEDFHAIDVEVNTVDRFQGKEKEIIFVSLVRNVKKNRRSIDSHIAAFQRINVAFSRAQNLLVIVGAKDMYYNQPVKITDMNNGKEHIIMAYQQIIDLLNYRAAYFSSDDVLPDAKIDQIIAQLEEQEGLKYDNRTEKN